MQDYPRMSICPLRSMSSHQTMACSTVTWCPLRTGFVKIPTTLLTQEYPAMLGLHNFYPPKEGEKAVEH